VLRAVVFDCDGVLVDSEPISERSWATVLARYGYTPTAGDHVATRGTSSADTTAYYQRFVAVPPGHDLLAEVDVERRRAFADELEAFPDAVASVRALAGEGVPLAVASSSGRVNLDLKLRKFDLLRYFDVTVAGDEVHRGKPAPDLFLEAAAGMNVAASDCLAIDDTEIGADAAIAAGMRTVQILRDGTLSEHHTVVSQLDPELILHWLGLR
jgi:HAD superfamily hydrolase (TIGR01509 family)